MATIDDFIEKGWNDHVTDLAGVAARLDRALPLLKREPAKAGAFLALAEHVLLSHLGGRIDAILRENYDSVRYMQELREALEEIDVSFQLANAGQDDKELLGK